MNRAAAAYEALETALAGIDSTATFTVADPFPAIETGARAAGMEKENNDDALSGGYVSWDYSIEDDGLRTELIYLLEPAKADRDPVLHSLNLTLLRGDEVVSNVDLRNLKGPVLAWAA